MNLVNRYRLVLHLSGMEFRSNEFVSSRTSTQIVHTFADTPGLYALEWFNPETFQWEVSGPKKD